MATEKPRITISLQPLTYDTYKRFAQLSAKPTATIISDILESSREEFEKIGVLLQQARELESRSHEEQSKFLARIEVMANRASASQEFIQSDLVTSISLPSAPPARGAKAPPAGAKKAAKNAPLSLIHTNKSHKSTPARLPARPRSGKGGRRASST